MKKIEKIDNYVINFQDDIYHCLPKLELNNVRTLLVMKGAQVLGTITDGDIRKILLNNRLLNIPVTHIMKSDYHFGVTEEECADIFRAYSYIFMVPLVTSEKELVSLFQRDV